MNEVINEIKGWINSASEETKRDIVFLPTQIMPGVPESIARNTNESAVIEFMNWMDSWTEAAMNGVGYILSFKICVEFTLIEMRDTQEKWDKTIKFNEMAVVEIEAKTGYPSTIRDTISKMPERAKEWIDLSKSWKEMWNNSITYNRLNSETLKTKN